MLEINMLISKALDSVYNLHLQEFAGTFTEAYGDSMRVIVDDAYATEPKDRAGWEQYARLILEYDGESLEPAVKRALKGLIG
jgi:hypothetical protein